MKTFVVLPCYHKKKEAIDKMVVAVRDLRFSFEPIFAKLNLLSPSS